MRSIDASPPGHPRSGMVGGLSARNRAAAACDNPAAVARVLIEACAELGIGKSQLYELLRRYRADPRTTSLVPATGGAPKGTDRRTPQAAAIIERTTDQFYLTRQKLTGAAVFRNVRQE